MSFYLSSNRCLLLLPPPPQPFFHGSCIIAIISALSPLASPPFPSYYGRCRSSIEVAFLDSLVCTSIALDQVSGRALDLLLVLCRTGVDSTLIIDRKGHLIAWLSPEWYTAFLFVSHRLHKCTQSRVYGSCFYEPFET